MKQFRNSAAILAFGILSVHTACADMTWKWHYEGKGIDASGSFTTSDTPDPSGFYRIIGITGKRNGEAIASLHQADKAIPGNEPYALDNLVRIGEHAQITIHGFGFSTTSGRYANPFFDETRPTPGYMEVLTNPPPSFSEAPITFSATPMPKP